MQFINTLACLDINAMLATMAVMAVIMGGAIAVALAVVDEWNEARAYRCAAEVETNRRLVEWCAPAVGVLLDEWEWNQERVTARETVAEPMVRECFPVGEPSAAYACEIDVTAGESQRENDFLEALVAEMEERANALYDVLFSTPSPMMAVALA
jgi:hypothetical protein